MALQQVSKQRLRPNRDERRLSLSPKTPQFVPYRSLPSLLPFDFQQEGRGQLSV
jgi:hypothetical protein